MFEQYLYLISKTTLTVQRITDLIGASRAGDDRHFTVQPVLGERIHFSSDDPPMLSEQITLSVSEL